MPLRRFAQRGHAQVSVHPSLGQTPRVPGRRVRRVAWALAMLVGALVAFQGWTLVRSTPSSFLGDSVIQPIRSGETLMALQVHQESAPPSSGWSVDAQTLKALSPLLGQAEARLIEVYQHIGQGRMREALTLADALVRDHPNFQLAQLVLGDLLSLQVRPVRQLGDVPEAKALAAMEQLDALRTESQRRLRALSERPPAGSVPSPFLQLAPHNRHAIAVDASRSRLYLFENTTAPQGTGELRLVGDFYISVGLQGTGKEVEGDKRTPLGVYFITSSLDPRALPDLYGVGALPINYPNALDLQRGKTGSGIWLHGTPREQFARAPQASDGCVVLSNPDLERLLATVQTRTTPVVIAERLTWVEPQALAPARDAFLTRMEAWRQARSNGAIETLRDFYSPGFRANGRDLAQWWSQQQVVWGRTPARNLSLKDLALLHWQDQDNTMVATFAEIPAGQRQGTVRRQYWRHEQGQWRIFYEGNA